MFVTWRICFQYPALPASFCDLSKGNYWFWEEPSSQSLGQWVHGTVLVTAVSDSLCLHWNTWFLRVDADFVCCRYWCSSVHYPSLKHCKGATIQRCKLPLNLKDHVCGSAGGGMYGNVSLLSFLRAQTPALLEKSWAITALSAVKSKGEAWEVSNNREVDLRFS